MKFWDFIGGVLFLALLWVLLVLVFSIPTPGDAPQGAPPGVQFESSTGLDAEPGEEESAKE